MEQRVQVLGVKGFKGTVEGTSYDSTTLYVVLPVSRNSKTEVGYNVREVKFGTEEEFQKLKSLKFPLLAELDLEMTTKGVDCFSFKPVPSSAAASPAKV